MNGRLFLNHQVWTPRPGPGRASHASLLNRGTTSQNTECSFGSWRIAETAAVAMSKTHGGKPISIVYDSQAKQEKHYGVSFGV